MARGDEVMIRNVVVHAAVVVDGRPFGRKHDVIATPFDSAADDVLASPRPVHVRRVEEGDAKVERSMQQAQRLVVIGSAISPPLPHPDIAADGLAAETDRRDLEVRLAKRAIFHDTFSGDSRPYRPCPGRLCPPGTAGTYVRCLGGSIAVSTRRR